jgi:hypothetical protein
MSSAVKVSRADHTAADLRALAVRTRDVAQSRRLLAIAMVLEGFAKLTEYSMCLIELPNVLENHNPNWTHVSCLQALKLLTRERR